MNENTKEIAERHRIRQKKKKKRLAFSMTIMFVLILVLASLLALMLTPLCNVRNIKINGAERVSEQAVVNTLAIDKDTKVYQIDKKLAQKRIQTLPYVKEVNIKTYIWGSVEVNITETEIGGYIRYGQNAVLFDETGKVINITGEIPEDVLKIEGCQLSSASAGEKIGIDTSEKFDIILMYISEFKKSDILKKMTMLDVSDGLNVKGIYDNRYDIFFGDFSELEHKIAMLKQAVAHNAENEMGTIDLRISSNAYVKPNRTFVTSNVKNEKSQETSEKQDDDEKINETSDEEEQTKKESEQNEQTGNIRKSVDENE